MSDPLNISYVRRHAGACARDNQGVGSAAIERIVRRVFNGEVAKWHGVFDVDIRKQERFRANPLPIANRVKRVAFDDALVRQHRPGMDVDAHKTSAARSAQGEGGMGVIAQNIETDGNTNRRTDGRTRDGHGRHSFGTDIAFGEWRVSKVFDDYCVDAATCVSPGISDRMVDSESKVTTPSRRTGQRRKMNHANDNFVSITKKDAHFCASVAKMSMKGQIFLRADQADQPAARPPYSSELTKQDAAAFELPFQTHLT